MATGEELAGLVHHPSADVLLALLDNPALDETQVCLLLERKDLPGEILEEIARRKALLKSYRVKKALAFHPRTARLVSLRLLRDLYLMDLVQVAILPGVSAELKRNAEEQLIARLPQLPLGQKITLARRGPARLICANWPRPASFRKAFANTCRRKCNAACAPAKRRQAGALRRGILTGRSKTEHYALCSRACDLQDLLCIEAHIAGNKTYASGVV